MEFFLGDFRYFWTENIGNFVQVPSSWDASLNTGIGKLALSSLWINSYLNFTAMFSIFGLSWKLISLFFWILPAIVLAFLSSFSLFNYLFRGKIKYSLLSGIIYTFNTYFLMVLTGGQLGVALAYSIAPIVLSRFIKLFDFFNSSTQNIKYQISNIKYAIIAGLVLAIQVLFDPRIVYVTLVAVLIYAILNIKSLTQNILSALYTFAIPFGIASFLHAFWIVPLLIFRMSPLPQNLKNVASFEFFSFADFSHALSLLHPNWPENVFGKTYFMRPEFLVLPILAFSSLLFISNINPFDILRVDAERSRSIKNQISKIHIKYQTILFFAILGLLGAFLAKGANEPFGIVNLWMFEHIPGFAMFRDPTKFYVLVALSYSILIPFSVSSISDWLISNIKKKIFLLFTILYLLFLIHPIFFGQIYKTREVPKEYIQLKDFLHSQPEFFRTLWIPQWQRFGYFSNQHPAIGREEIFKGNAKKQIAQLKKPNTERILRELSVKYIIVPYDSEGEIFLNDRKYDNNQYLKTIGELKQIKWLKQVNCSIVKLLNCYDNSPFGRIVVFEVPDPRDHFWTPSKTLRMEYKFINPTKYLVQVENAKKGDLLVFSEGFDEKWLVESSKFKVQSSKFGNMLNSFVLPKDGNYMLKVYYEPQKWVDMGLGISGITLLAIFVVLGLGKVRSK